MILHKPINDLLAGGFVFSYFSIENFLLGKIKERRKVGQKILIISIIWLVHSDLTNVTITQISCFKNENTDHFSTFFLNMAAAIGSSIRYTSRVPAPNAD